MIIIFSFLRSKKINSKGQKKLFSIFTYLEITCPLQMLEVIDSWPIIYHIWKWIDVLNWYHKYEFIFPETWLGWLVKYSSTWPFFFLQSYLISFYNQVTCVVDGRKAVDLIYPGFSKAIDTVFHSILLGKLAARVLDRYTLYPISQL